MLALFSWNEILKILLNGLIWVRFFLKKFFCVRVKLCENPILNNNRQDEEYIRRKKNQPAIDKDIIMF